MVKNLAVLLLTVFLFLSQAGMAWAGTQIIINKTTNQLQYLRDGVIVNTFPVATGKHPAYTPEGNFTVVVKLINPYYSKLGIPGGNPKNPLGARWLGLSIGGGGVYGIHGTNNTASIGTYASAGCIRMYNKDVTWLYNHTSLGTPVNIISAPATPKPKPVVIAVEGRRVTVELAGLSADGSPLLPLRTVFKLLGYTVRWDSTSSTVNLLSINQNIFISCTNGIIITEDKIFKLAEIKIIGGTAYGPLSLWRQIMPAAQVDWDPRARVVTFTRQTGAGPLSEPFLPLPGTPAPSPGGLVPDS